MELDCHVKYKVELEQRGYRSEFLSVAAVSKPQNFFNDLEIKGLRQW